MKNLFVLFCGLGIFMYLTSCKKEDKCKAGAGGSLTIVATIQHHGKDITSKSNYKDTVYVKYNTQEFPGDNPSSYDMTIVGETGENHVHISGLKCGDYFIYAVGYDTTISKRVKGGIPFTTEKQSGEVNITIPVTED